MNETIKWLHCFIVTWLKIKNKNHVTMQPCSNSCFQLGFSLIELIVVFSIIAIMSTIGIASFIDYSRTQTLNTATLELTTFLQKAKSRALSQLNQSNSTSLCTGGGTISGYQVKFCPITGSSCTSSDDYELHIVCKSSSGTESTILRESKKLPSSLQFVEVSGGTPSVLFRILTGQVEGVGDIRLQVTGGGQKTITVNPLGSISVN